MPILSIVYFIIGVILIIIGFLVFKNSEKRAADSLTEYLKEREERGKVLGIWVISVGVSYLIGAMVAFIINNDNSLFVAFFISMVWSLPTGLYVIKKSIVR